MNNYEEYQKLIDDVRVYFEKYSSENKKVELKWCSLNYAVDETKKHICRQEPGVSFCEEINLWTYWQGRNFFSQQEVDRIKYLVVGQDWGNAFNFEDPLIRNIIDMNNGKDSSYFKGMTDKQISVTDYNLIELFEKLGYTDIKSNSYKDLFFTNYCLGYRTGKDSGGMTLKQMNTKEEKEFFRKLCTVLKPQNILCLGENVFRCVCASLEYDVPQMMKKGYNSYLESKLKDEPCERVIFNGMPCNVFGLSHCGHYGVQNRKSDHYPDEKGLEIQMRDWERIKKAEEK